MSHNPAWQWCHKQQVLWIHLLPRASGEKPLKSLSHHKRGGSWGEEGEIWAICQFFHSIRAGYAKEKQVWMSLLVMVTARWPLAEDKQCLRGCHLCGNNLLSQHKCATRAPLPSYVCGTFEGTQTPQKGLVVFRAERHLRSCRQNQTEWVMMCQQPAAPGFTLANSQVCWSSVSHPDPVILAEALESDAA